MMIEDLMLVAGYADPILKRSSIRFVELDGLPIVLPGTNHVLRNIIDHTGARLGFKPNVVIDSDSLTAISQLVRCGYVTVMPHFAMLDEINRGEMGAIPITDPTPSWRLSVVVSQRTINTRASEVVAGALADVIHSMVDRGIWQASHRDHVQ
jgi:DNA-binding transcriptional LysR family regulator